ncbi:MAG: type II toxin-antitoxin system RelE family toxin [Dethiobacteria bacterium]|jgi:mRNA-degrading endonuclease RelE of RelBE toxin-antitoxin system
MHIEYRRSALKEIKKLDKLIRKEMVSRIKTCAENPKEGKSLKGDLSSYLSYDFIFKGVSYRIIYTIDKKSKTITIEMVGSRENIYKYLKRML